ncbi:MAG: DUF1850 domain-containing protein [Clostridium sp.]|nr:DUF1850 domain-containing protein [Clostridium sp.]
MNIRFWGKFRTAAAAAVILIAVAAVLYMRQGWYLTLRNAGTGQLYGRYRMREGDGFSVGFVHSVNKSPVTDFYEIKNHAIYVEKTVYYGFGAGVQTELEDGQILSYGEDGSMIVSGFDQKMNDLTYFVGTVSDHTMKIREGGPVSLRDLCGRNSRVRFSYEHFWK